MIGTQRLRFQQYIPTVLVISVFGVYLSTICPTVYLGDSGELSAAAYSLGIPHSSGYPLYTLLGRIFCLIPVGHVAFRLNLMSAVFAVVTVWIVYGLILEIASCPVSAVFASLFLAFVPLLWSQTVFAEVYTLHAFFVALLTRLLWGWDRNRQFRRLALFVFITGISFGNHMQTVMLAPAALVIVLSVDHRTVVNPKNLLALTTLFALSLGLYAYLPIRTLSGAAIHWGDPDTLSRFIDHVTARSHREGYVFTKTGWEYILRTRAIIWTVVSQFGIATALAVWGWLKLASIRWRLFFLGVVLFDLFYSVFLNIISLEITPFGIPTCIAIAILLGVGTAHIMKAITCHPAVGNTTRKAIGLVLCLAPAIPLFVNYGFCDQSSNYTAYEHALNTFRTVGQDATIILDGDNNIFPVSYGRVVERMREDVILFDRPNLFFKMPNINAHADRPISGTKNPRPAVEKRIIERAPNGVYFGVFNPAAINLPRGYALHPYGILHRITGDIAPGDTGGRVWSRYVSLSITDDFRKDFMNRQVAAYFHFALGKYFFMADRPENGLKFIQAASEVGYDDTTIHSDIAVFLTDRGFFKEARLELEKAMICYEDLSGVHNNWGYYYNRLGNYHEAAGSYRKAIRLRPNNYGYYNNLGLTLHRAGDRDGAALAFRKSLSINPDQPELEGFLKEEK